MIVVMTESRIIDTILNGAANFLQPFTPITGAVLMFFFQFIFSGIITSGSGQAAATMPLMVPLGDLIGITRQTSVVVFQLGDGLSNTLWPTAGPLMAGLSMVSIPYERWLRWFAPLMVFFFIAACVISGVCAYLAIGPF
jgi:uncharacterized ion transporter superfamily protein YfcC